MSDPMRFTKTVYTDQYPAINPTNPQLSQAGRVAIVSGASRGIGKAIALAFAKAAVAGLVLVSRSAAPLEDTKLEAQQLNANAKIVCVPADTTSYADVDRIESAVRSEFGTASILVNAAGSWDAFGKIGEVSNKAWWKEFKTNVKGSQLMTSAFLHLLGSEDNGSVVNLTSMSSFRVFPGGSSYALSKFTLNRLTEFVAAENPNVTCVAYHPGNIATELLKKFPQFQHLCKETMDLASGVPVYLCSPQARFLSGRYISANWSVNDLEEKQEEIVSGNLLKLVLKGEFGTEGVKYF